MRELKSTNTNKLVVHDGLSGGEIELYYRTPTTAERVSYMSRLVKREKDKVKMRSAETRLHFGMEILTGFKDGAFGFDGNPISSDPAHPNYREDWKDLVKETASDLVSLLGFVVFEGARVEGQQDGIEIEEEVAEDAVPFGKS
jgi:hypothetical protein